MFTNSSITIAGAVSAAAPRWSEQDEMAHIEDDLRTGEIGTMAEEQNTTTLTFTFMEMLELQGSLLERIQRLEKSVLILSDGPLSKGPVIDLVQQQLDTTKDILAKVDQIDRANVDRLLEAIR